MKRSVFYFLILALFLAACAPQTPPSPALGEGTGVRETPPPVVPTPTVPPQFIALQEQIAQSGEVYTLNVNGQIEMQTPEGMIIIPNISISRNGEMIVTHNNNTFEADPTSIKIDGQTLTFQSIDGKTWVFNGENLTEGVVFPPEMTDKYKNQFETFEYGVKQVNGVDTKVIYGIKSDETKQVIAMEMEIDGKIRMTRVGETVVKDQEGNDHSFYTYIDPKWSSTGIFSVTDRTSKGIVGMPEGKNDANMWNSLAHQLGFATPEQAFEHVMVKNDGIANFKVAYGFRQKAANISKMKTLENPANFNLPIEIKTIMTTEEYDSLPDEIRNNLIQTDFSINNEAGVKFGYLLWTKPSGQIVIYSISTAAEYWGYNSDNRTLADADRKMITDFYEDQIVYAIFDSMGMMVSGKSNLRSYARQSRNFLEIEGINFKDPSQ